ncbi:MAG: 2TM domain-containing protein [Flavobacteriaceae bacterium]|nr:2TM domain-containing protein [Bacteroidia bacterium]MBT8288457.1 2TM domain-containing protein [Bacteroidia bacterium]NNF75875.1 2TM domain-containing protein [Flavobacteriaceae bacterium]NNK72037.1 2TM domain-containing protein [Flavobacteriaceae bacterium]
MDNRLTKYIDAKERIAALRRFYFHLMVFIPGVLGIAALIFLIEEGPDKQFWVWLILSTIITWIVIMVIHVFSVYGNRLLFSKNWENRKISKYLKREDQTNPKQ